MEKDRPYVLAREREGVLPLAHTPNPRQGGRVGNLASNGTLNGGPR